MAYLVSRMVGQQTDKVKLMKLLYLADRDHFLEHGRPITGDDQYALPLGPAGTLSLNLLAGQFEEGKDGRLFDYIETQDHRVVFRREPPHYDLIPTEIAVLDATINRYGTWGIWELRDFTHALPEYVEKNCPGTSTRIPFELLKSIYQKRPAYCLGRPVITPEMAALMPCPFIHPEPDL